jgi:YD repeat-containing protein
MNKLLVRKLDAGMERQEEEGARRPSARAARRRRGGAGVALVVALCASLLPAPGAWAQERTGDDNNLADSLADFDRSLRDLENRVDDLERQVRNSAIDIQEDNARLQNGGLLPGFSEHLGTELAQISVDLGSVQASSCTSAYGASLTVPFGSYEGNQLLTVSESLVSRQVSGRRLTALGGAWSFEPGGLLVRTIVLGGAIPIATPGLQEEVDCLSTIVYRYFGPRGDFTFIRRAPDTDSCQYTAPNTIDPTFCGLPVFGGARFPSPCVRGTLYWSTQGQVALDVTAETAPMLRFPDGSVEVMGNEQGDWSIIPPAAVAPFYAHHQGFFAGSAAVSNEAYWTTDHTLDRNGNRTSYAYDLNSRQLTSITDPRGRTTTYQRDSGGDITSITRPGFGGAPLTWTLTWQQVTWQNPNLLFPEIGCYDGFVAIACPDQTFTTLTRLALPDGRAYAFTYGGWGNLIQVTTPDGAVTVHTYGDRKTSSFVPSYLEFLDGQGTSDFIDHCPAGMNAILKRRLVSTTLYPMPGAPPETTLFAHAAETALSPTPAASACYKVQWIHTTYPDGRLRKTGICVGNASPAGSALSFGPTPIDGRVLAEEVWGPGGLLEGTYYGNSGTIGDTATPAGFMYLAWEGSGAQPLDIRPLKVVHVKDGIQWSETFTYDMSSIPADAGRFRTYGNVIATSTIDAAATVLREIDTSFVTDPNYLAKNLVRLTDTVVVREGGGKAVSRTSQLYDQFPLTASGAPSREDPGPYRGNATTVQRYKVPHGATGAVATQFRFYDTGELQQTIGPRGAQTTMSHPAGDFATCPSHPTVTVTTANAFLQSSSTVGDCVTGATIRQTDVNGQVTQSTYDRLGRLTAVTRPGDSTPSQWFEYFYLGSSDNSSAAPLASLAEQRTVVHTKDGSADGHYVETFLDGLARAVQTRAKVDPATSGGASEVVTTTEYDGMGRPFRRHVPCYAAASNVKSDCPSPLFTTTAYDALGRIVSVTPPGLPPTLTSYAGQGTTWAATVTAASDGSHLTRTLTDALGRRVETDRLWSGCSGCWLATTMTYDAAGRVNSIKDPQGNVTTLTYDGLGRKLTMSDPDLGGFAGLGWTYQYDDDGNLTAQTDPKGQTISQSFDALDRITLRDLPPAGPGEEDITFSYDGLVSVLCYSCDDHCPTTVDACDPSTLTCTHVGTPCTGAAAPCTYALSPPTAALAAGPSAANTVAVSTSAGCAWTAVSNAAWIAVTAGASGSGAGTVTYGVVANVSTTQRSGTMTVAGQTFTVTQAGGTRISPITATASSSTADAPPAFAVDGNLGTAWNSGGFPPASLDLDLGGTYAVSEVRLFVNQLPDGPTTHEIWGGPSTGSLALLQTLSGPTRAWTWLEPTFTPPINVRVLRVKTTASPSWVSWFEVEVYGAPVSCTSSISPASAAIGSGGLSGSTVAVTSSCAWTAASNAAWITVTAGASGSGSGTVTYGVAANPSTAQRSGTMTIAGQTFAVTQDGAAACSYSITPASNQHGSAGGGGNVNVTTSPGCAWTASPGVAWLHVTSGGAGSGSGSLSYSVDANPSSSARSGTITVAGQTFTAFQAGLVAGNYSVALFAPQDRYVEVASSPSLDMTGAFTVEAWVNTSTPTAAQQGIVERYNWTAGDDGGFAFRLAGGQVQLWIIRNASSWVKAQGTSIITPGWHHVAGVFDGAQVLVYLDGELDGSTAAALVPAAGTASLKIGARGDDHSNPFQGQIDEVRLSTGALYSASFAPVPHLQTIPGATVGLWKFDDQTASDSSGSGNHGAFRNGAVASTDFPEYGSLALDGVAAYFEVPDSPSLDLTGSVTLEAWVKTNSTAAPQRLLVRAGATGGGYSLRLLAGGRLKMSIYNSTTLSDGLAGTSALSTGVWHHVAAVSDGAAGQYRLYVDGVLDASKSSAVTAGTGASNLRIGAALDGSEPWNGNLDEVRLTRAVVYKDASFVPSHHLTVVDRTKGLWRFDRAYGSDASGWGNHGSFFLGAGIGPDVP